MINPGLPDASPRDLSGDLKEILGGSMVCIERGEVVPSNSLRISKSD